MARNSPNLAELEVFRRLNNFEGVSVLAVRLWLDRRIAMAQPSNVFGGVDPGVGGTFFDLNALQDEYQDEMGSVVEIDLYNSAPFMGMSDEQIVNEVKNRSEAGRCPMASSRHPACPRRAHPNKCGPVRIVAVQPGTWDSSFPEQGRRP